MADWINCPGCGLKHSRRPDGVCPRCKQSVDDSAAIPIDALEPSADAPPVASGPPPSMAGLGDLAQSARGKELKSARVIMFFVGALSIAVNLFFFSSAEKDVQTEIDKEIAKLGPGFVVDQEKVAVLKKQAVGAAHLINGGGIVVGMIFVACGLLVQKHPVPATITALALYLAAVAIFGLIDPASLASGIIIKVFVVIGLFKAVQAAIAYQKELAAGT
jgi:hypothetical protein